MINPDDPQEWLEQIEQAPEAAPAIFRLLVARLEQLEETNQALRNANIELEQKLDTRAHQKEVDELRRQIEALARLTRARAKHADGPALIAWSSNGHALAFGLDSGELNEASLTPFAFRFPAHVKLHLLAAPLAQEILVLTNWGQSAVFQVQELVRVTQETARWHQLPGLSLHSGEFVSAMTPISDLPLCHSLITASREGYVRSILRWSMDRFLPEGQFGKGVKQDHDFQTCAQLCLEPTSNIILFTTKGNYVRFPENSLSSSLIPGVKLDEDDHIAGMALDDRPESQVLIVDSKGHGARRALKSLPARPVGTKPQAACVTQEAIVGVSPVGDYDRVIVLMANGKLAILDADQAPLANRARALAPLPGVTSQVLAFTTASF